MDKLAQRVIRPAVEAIGLEWYGWHGFRRGVASNLYALGADEKIVQRILRHAHPHVTKERYIKAFDPAVMEAMERLQATVELLEASPAIVQQVPNGVPATFNLRERKKGEGAATFVQLAQYAEGPVCLTGGDEGSLASALVHGGEDAGRKLVDRLIGILW